MTDKTSTRQAQTLRQVDPAILIVGVNVRADARLDKGFLASLKANGVLQPIIVTEDSDGMLTVLYGKRRTLGSVEAGLSTVPVVVLPADEDEAGRIVTQLGENDHRAEVTANDRRAAYEQLSAIGLTAAQIVRRTGRPKAEVAHAVKASTSELAKASVERYDFLTLEDAAIIAEFEDDTDTVKTIVAAAKRGESTVHLAQRARDDKARDEARARTVESLTAEGTKVIERPGYEERTITRLNDLRLGDAGKAPSPAEHSECPGHGAYLGYSHGIEGPEVVYVCTAPKQYGHTRIGYNGQVTSAAGGPMSEEAKAERRRVVENNKAWESAEKVRREWLAQWTPGTTAPAGVERFIAEAVANRESAEDVPYDQRPALAAKVATASPRAALRLTAALLAIAWDAKTGRHTWRNPSEKDRRYMDALVQWGYQPSDVEKLVLAKPKRK